MEESVMNELLMVKGSGFDSWNFQALVISAVKIST